MSTQVLRTTFRLTLRCSAPEFVDFYSKKFAEATTHNHTRAISLTARKLIRLIFGLSLWGDQGHGQKSTLLATIGGRDNIIILFVKLCKLQLQGLFTVWFFAVPLTVTFTNIFLKLGIDIKPDCLSKKASVIIVTSTLLFVNIFLLNNSYNK